MHADITYGTNNEFGFDYLRDNMKFRADEMVQRPFNFAIVDEVDSILIDEARTPLIISGPTEDKSELYIAVDQVIVQTFEPDALRAGREGKRRHPDRGRHRTGRADRCATGGLLTEGTNLYDMPEHSGLVHHVNQALRANILFQRDNDYIVKRRQGHHHRRVHRPHDGRPPLVRGPAPGGRGQGRRRRSSPRTRRSPRSPSRTISACTPSCRA